MDKKVAKADAKYQKIHSQKRKKDSSDRKVGNEIFDKLTLETLYKLANQGYIDILNGAISTGKEANVLLILKKWITILKEIQDSILKLKIKGKSSIPGLQKNLKT